MPSRDRISEILAIRSRSGRHAVTPTKWDIERLAEIWAQKLKTIEFGDSLVPIRIVTLVEVCVRGWIEKLVAQGAPYLERAANLKVDLKYDFAIASSLHGQVVTLAQLIAHSVPLGRFENIVSVLQVLLGEDLFASISNVRDQVAVEIKKEPDVPIINDIEDLRRTLGRLFDVRHILVHEFPQVKPHKVSEVDDFLRAATLFVQAVDEMLHARLYGRYPLTQGAMNRDAAERSAAARNELKALCEKIVQELGAINFPGASVSDINDVQNAWQAFCDAEAARESKEVSGGSMRPLIYSSVAERLTRARIEELQRWLDDKQYFLETMRGLAVNPKG
jgi:uncharacterized protein YecT (DUF1311 family)